MVSARLGKWYLEVPDSSQLFQYRHKTNRLDVGDVTSHLLRAYVLEGNNHPAKDYPHLFSEEFPQAVLTYEWKSSMSDVSNVLNDPKVLNHPTLLRDQNVRRGRNGNANPRVWVDVLFIDQLARNIPVELGVAQEYYILCLLHIVAGSDSLLRRGWCLWELGLRAHSKKESLIIGSLGFQVSSCKYKAKIFGKINSMDQLFNDTRSGCW